MKVLSWMTRRLVQSCTTFPQDDEVERDHVKSKLHVERHALLEHGAQAIVDVLSDWNDGILAIGTLAIGPLETTYFEMVEEVDYINDHHQEDSQVLDDLHNSTAYDSDDDLGANPLMNVALFSHELEKEVGTNIEIMEEVPKNVTENECETKKRVTLADLLSADSHHHLVKQLGDKLYHVDAAKDNSTVAKPCFKMTKQTPGAKNGQSKAKKLLKEDLRPLKKLNQLMKRMMKKKIHPDLEGKIQKDMEMQPSNVGAVASPTKEEGAAHGSPSLLLIRDAVMI